MLPSGRSVGEHIFACDEGVMGLHNDRRTGGKMPANDRRDVICAILLIYFYICFKAGKRLNGYKATFCLVYLGRFSPCSSVMYIKYTPSAHVENRLKLYDPAGNIYY